jgi:transcription termination/antitermination protein NusA
MTSDLLALMEYYEKEKGIERSVMIEAISNALLAAGRRSVGPARELRVEIDPDKGRIKAIARLVVTDGGKPSFETIPLELARKIRKDAQIGEEVDVEVTPQGFGRIAAQTAKQAIMQRLRQAEKEMIYEEFKDRAGDIVQGTVRRFDKTDIVVDLGKFEGIMPNRERVPNETYHVGDRFRFYVVAVENGARGPEIILSRSHPNFVRRLFEFEVSEIADRTVEIRSIAREAGYRTKIAVFAADPKMDPVGACVGLRGARVKNIVRELNNEKVDIIRWTDNVLEFVRESLKPAKITDDRIQVLEGSHRVEVRVPEEELSKAIGLRGRNARLTSRLIGWDVQVMKDETKHEQFGRKIGDAVGALAAALGISSGLAESLTTAGFLDAGVIADSDPADLVEAANLDEATAAEVHAKAKAIHAVGA